MYSDAQFDFPQNLFVSNLIYNNQSWWIAISRTVILSLLPLYHRHGLLQSQPNINDIIS